MQATEPALRPSFKFSDSATCRLPPAVLFDLLADITERQKWDSCPPYVKAEPIMARPGAALGGARYTASGTVRGIPFEAEAVVIMADRPYRYATRSVTRFARALPTATALEEYRMLPEGTGSLVHYSVEITKHPGTGHWLTRTVNALLEPLLGKRALRKNFRDVLLNAERHVGVVT